MYVCICTCTFAYFAGPTSHLSITLQARGVSRNRAPQTNLRHPSPCTARHHPEGETTGKGRLLTAVNVNMDNLWIISG